MSAMPTLPTASELAGRQARLHSVILAEPEKARQELQHILSQAQAIGSAQQQATALVNLAGCAFLQGDYVTMLAHSQKALAIANLSGTRDQQARALNSLGLAHQRLGALEPAMLHLMECLRLAMASDDDTITATALGNIALLHVTLGEYETALKYHEQALEIAQSNGIVALTADMLESILEDHYHLGDYATALDLAWEAISYPQSHDLARYECSARATLGRILLALGRYQAGARAARAGYGVARRAKDAETLARLNWVEGQALTHLGYHDAAQTRLHKALRIDSELGNKRYECESHDALANLYTARGEVGLAQQHREAYLTLRAKLLHPSQVGLSSVPTADTSEASAGQHPWTEELNNLTSRLERANTDVTYRLAHDPQTGVLTGHQFLQRVQRQLDFLVPDEIVGVVKVGIDVGGAGPDDARDPVPSQDIAAIASTLKKAVREGDFVGRLGSDELGVCLTHLANAADMSTVMTGLLTTLRESLHSAHNCAVITASLGGCLAPRDGDTAEDLLTCADIVLNQVRSAGRDDAAMFEAEVTPDEQFRRSLSYDLRTACDNREFELHYQGIFDMFNGLLGYEALVRWNHPSHGLLLPDSFITLSESGRQILDIGDWVLDEACRQAAEWSFAERGLTMSVNVSPLQFAQADFVTSVSSILKSRGVPPQVLVIEVTESMIHEDLTRALQHMTELRSMGAYVALDDFGTGFSCLSLLQDMAVDSLKVDRSFLRNLSAANPKFPRSQALLVSLVHLAKSLDLAVLAEGVETAEQYALLRDMGCDRAQGYWLSQPRDTANAAQLLRANAPAARDDTSCWKS